MVSALSTFPKLLSWDPPTRGKTLLPARHWRQLLGAPRRHLGTAIHSSLLTN